MTPVTPASLEAVERLEPPEHLVVTVTQDPLGPPEAQGSLAPRGTEVLGANKACEERRVMWGLRDPREHLEPMEILELLAPQACLDPQDPLEILSVVVSNFRNICASCVVWCV